MDFMRIEIIGTVQPRDAEQQFTPDGRSVVLFRVVAGRSRKQADGTWLNKSEWFRVRVFGPMAEFLSDKLLKGTRLYVTGRFETREWTTNSGENRTELEVVASEIVLLGDRPSAQSPSQETVKNDDTANTLEDLPW